ncbi:MULTISPECIES: NADH-quinone oxidoreductase subunit NuoG [unclassified Microbulbifer]|uniref:NADH-quinone oxidoreductase subunit NuoG n=1 Tax=unclassified Microbulbifer TaxID=2619833 RepID=UPI0027E5A627|nr:MULTISPECIES: NADH-quinone oxidoreductase subunit NuoG [unclassified Microbulbifer]
MPTITIDGDDYEVEEGQNLLSTCLSLGIDLPYFCWHPAMGSVGACRQCAVIEYKDAEDHRGRLVMSCMTPVKDGGLYSVNAEQAREFRGSIIEDLMTNHPHDCPVCEEGGECHLQDMTEMTGHTNRRYRGTKRTHRNQYLGPFINHEMNRCIACYRCTRFYRDYAGGTDLQALGRNNQVYFGRQQEGVLQNGFSGNLVEVCPTGVFTDKTFSKHYVRKWDLQTAPSICEHCAVGCNTAPGARAGWDGKDQMLRRVINLYHREINGYFLCDRGRFGYDYVNSDMRLKTVLAARTDTLIESTAARGEKIHGEIPPREAVERLGQTLGQAQKGQRRLIGIGSPRASLENNFALRQLVGPDNFYAGLAERDLHLLHLVDAIQRDPRTHSPTIPEIENADAILILGEDISNTAPRVALAVRQAARNRQRKQARELKIPQWQDASVRQLDGDPSPVALAGFEDSGLDDIASSRFHGTPEEIATFGHALAQLIAGKQPAEVSPEYLEMAQKISEALSAAERPLVISGCGCRSGDVLQAAAQLATALADRNSSPCALYLACPEVNSLGLAQLCTDDKKTLDHLPGALQAESEAQNPSSVIVLENDLCRRVDTATADEIFSLADELIALDLLHNRTTRRADLVLPAAATAESQGTVINSNGLAQRFYAVYEGPGYIQESWRWLADAAAFCPESNALIRTIADWKHCHDLNQAIAETLPELEVVADLGPDEDFRIDGLEVARQSHRYSGRTAIYADKSVAEHKPVKDPDAPLVFSMEGIQDPDKSPLQANIWSPGWNSNQALHKFLQGIGGKRRCGNGGRKIQRASRSLPDWKPAVNPAGEAEGFLLLPIYRMFGSGELSAMAPAIASVIAQPFVLINRHDAKRLDIDAGDPLEITVGGDRCQLIAEVSDTIPTGSLGVPYGFPQVEPLGTDTPARGRLQVAQPETGGDR